MTAFADRLVEAVRKAGAPLCVGLDPFADKIPHAVFGDPRGDVGTLTRFSEALIEAARGHAGVIKVQLGLFEPFGPEGVAAARSACRFAMDLGFVVILDAKRGDIGTTAEGYAAAALGPLPGFDADCVTVNPYMGADTIAPFVSVAQARGKGVAVLVRTSNPGARDLQDLSLAGAPLWTHTARMAGQFCEALLGQSGWSGLMAVAGATYPEEAKALRTLLPEALFLVPGYGAQGASARDAVAGFVHGKVGLEGGVVNASRAVAYPADSLTARTPAAWRAAIDAAMARAHGELAAAISE